MFKPEIKQRALELRSKGYSAGLVLKHLEKEFSDEQKLPDEKTIRVWGKKAGINEENTKKEVIESSGDTLVTNKAIYKKVTDIHPWMKKPLKWDNSE